MQAPLPDKRKQRYQNGGMSSQAEDEALAPGTAELRRELRVQLKEFGRRLRSAREKAEFTQEQIGATLELSSHSAVGQWERGTSMVAMVNLIALAETYKTSLDWMVFGMKGGTLEDRIERLPEPLCSTVRQQVKLALESAEEMARSHPKFFDEKESVRDEDVRLTVWNAAEKIAKLNAARKETKAAAKPAKPRKRRSGNA